MSRTLTARLLIAAKVVLTGLIFWFIYEHRGQDGNLVEVLSKVSMTGLGAAVVLLLGQAALNALRWQLIAGLFGPKPGFSRALQSVMTGLFFNQVLPSTVGGDAVRWWYAYRSGIPALEAFSSVALDRMIGLLMLILLTLAMAPIAGDRAQQFVPFWLFWAMLVVTASGVAALPLLSRLPERMRSLRPLRLILRLAEDARRVLLNLKMTPALFIISAVAQVLSISSACVLAKSMALSISPEIFFFVVPPALLLAALPVSLGGWGVREGAFVFGLGLFSVSTSDALAIAIMFGLASLLVGLIGGIAWWSTKENAAPAGSYAHEMREALSAAVSEK